VCGEHGGDPESIQLFYDAGLDYVSCSPFRVPIARLACAQAVLRSSRPPASPATAAKEAAAAMTVAGKAGRRSAKVQAKAARAAASERKAAVGAGKRPAKAKVEPGPTTKAGRRR
jgi:phosphoenolpyruvate-protein kinase (PTS system EI component)